jgi:hypothetical protein
MLLLAPWVLLVVWGIYVAMFASAIETDAAGTTVQNFLRRTRLPWSIVTDVHLRYQVVFVYDGAADGPERQLKAFGGPVAGRPGRPRGRGADAARREPPALREVELIREQWQTALEDGTGAGAVTRSWDWLGVGAFAVLVAWAVLAVLITGGPA